MSHACELSTDLLQLLRDMLSHDHRLFYLSHCERREVRQDLKATLAANDQSGAQDLLDPLDQSFNEMIKGQDGEVGARMSWFIVQHDRRMQVSDQLIEDVSQTEEADLAKIIQRTPLEFLQ